jgi:hypothetical protein
VITQGQMNGDFERIWTGMQDEFADESTNSLHVVAKDSGHLINQDAPKLVVAAVEEVVASARGGGSKLSACGPELEAVGAECLAGAMGDLYEQWEHLRAAVVPTAGDLPDGVYTETLTRDDYKRLADIDLDHQQDVITWTLKGGQWSVAISPDGKAPDETADVYDVDGSTMTFRLPLDWKVPRTPGVNTLTWSVDAAGTLRFSQTDPYVVEPAFGKPWTRVSDAP